MLFRRGVVLTAGIIQLLICYTECQECDDQLKPDSCLDIKNREQCESVYADLCRKTCGLCTTTSTTCPDGFYDPGGKYPQCFRVFAYPLRNWDQAKKFCFDNGWKLATPNDDVLGKVRTYVESRITVELDHRLGGYSSAAFEFAWLGGRWSSSVGFEWSEVDVPRRGGGGGQKVTQATHPWWDSNTGRRIVLPGRSKLDGHPGWFPGVPGKISGQPGFCKDINCCLQMSTSAWNGASVPYGAGDCSLHIPTLCQMYVGP